MLLSKTRKEGPKDEVSKNANLLIRAGFVSKEMAGVYSYLPLGLRVMKKIEDIIRDEMNKIGGVEMKTSVIQSKEVWEKSNRWDDAVVDNWFKTKLKNGGEVGLSFTNEEAYANILKQYISSYKDLPMYPYDFKNIFRNEARSKSGMLRGREFYWKALYSFSKNEAEHNEFYEKSKIAYKNVYNRVGLGDITYITFASGGSFSKFSHEFQSITDAGEDIIYLDEKKNIAVNKEVYDDEILKELGLNKKDLVEKKAIEVGNIFSLGTRFSEPFNLTYKDEKGEEKLVIMGSYGIGLSRLMGTIVEILSDDKGIVWPVSIAPFKVHLIEIASGNPKVKETAEYIYKKLSEDGIEVLYDDRDTRAGEKFNDSDLIGIPLRIVVSEKGIDAETFEVKERKDGKVSVMNESEMIDFVKKYN
ncbi:MAG: His/Gly/Thr/Pro-type tRNA ligase C-terminal domain-containing protein [Candidatus Pacebacteria bacterium]|nr:His/Gly/Thr/Pro-type tRNA ligase C-terminal domain-containing protein [Candidatus Paceibacterota bacterium]